MEKQISLSLRLQILQDSIINEVIPSQCRDILTSELMNENHHVEEALDQICTGNYAAIKDEIRKLDDSFRIWSGIPNTGDEAFCFQSSTAQKRASGEIMQSILEEIDGYSTDTFEGDFDEPINTELLQSILDEPFNASLSGSSDAFDLSISTHSQPPRRLSAEIFEEQLNGNSVNCSSHIDLPTVQKVAPSNGIFNSQFQTPYNSFPGSITVSPRNHCLQRLFNGQPNSIPSKNGSLTQPLDQLQFHESSDAPPFKQEKTHKKPDLLDQLDENIHMLHSASHSSPLSSPASHQPVASEGIMSLSDNMVIEDTPNVQINAPTFDLVKNQLENRRKEPMFEIPKINTQQTYCQTDCKRTAQTLNAHKVITPDVVPSGIGSRDGECIISEGTLSSQSALEELSTIQDILKRKVARVTPSSSPCSNQNQSPRQDTPSTKATTVNNIETKAVTCSQQSTCSEMASSPTVSTLSSNQMMLLNPMMMMMMMQNLASAQKVGSPKPNFIPAVSPPPQLQPRRRKRPLASFPPLGGSPDSMENTTATAPQQNFMDIRPAVSQTTQRKHLEEMIAEQLTLGLVSEAQATVLRCTLNLGQPWILSQMENVLTTRSAGDPAPLHAFIGVAMQSCGMMPVVRPMTSSCPSPVPCGTQEEKLDTLKSQIECIQDQLRSLRKDEHASKGLGLAKDLKKLSKKIRTLEKKIPAKKAKEACFKKKPS